MKRNLLLFGLAIILAWPFGVDAATPLVTVNPPTRGTVLEARPGVQDDESPMVYRVKITSGPLRNKEIQIGAAGQPVSSIGVQTYAHGDRVVMDSYQDQDGTTQYVITDYQRQTSLLWLLVLFVAAVIWLTRWRGVRSIAGLFLSYVVMLYWLVPRIANGHDPVIESIIGCTAILFASILITEGFSRRSLAALSGMVATMIVTVGLSALAIWLAHLTGQADEEALYVKNLGSGTIDLRGLLLAGFIIGALGILDDVAVGQVATVAELRVDRQELRSLAVYRRAMRVGMSHLSAIINTLVLAYAGSSLPLLVLFSASGMSFTDTVSNEIVATEIVRTLVGSIGIVLALPLTTAMAVWFRVTPHGDEHHYSHGS